MTVSDQDGKMVPTSMLSPDELVQGAAHQYKVIRYLGEGLTAVVYLAEADGSELQVALKVLRPEASQISQESFWQEGLNLTQLWTAGVQCVPQVYEQQRAGRVLFLAMEYIPRKEFVPLGDILQSGAMPEAEALEMAAQALDLLDKLHTQVQRTYVDMQMKNFCWNSTTKQLKVLDWNTVSPPRETLEGGQEKIRLMLANWGVEDFEGLVQRDLARFSTYLYIALTGKGTREQGEPARLLEERGGEVWANLALATRQLVLRALSLNRAQRFASAANYLRAVKEVQDLLGWVDGDEQYMDEVEEISYEAKRVFDSREASSEDQNNRLLQLDRVAALIDLFVKRKVVVDQRAKAYQDRLTQMTRGISANWAVGERYFGIGQYREALKSWEPEAIAQGRALLWRWVQAAKVGMAMGETSFQPLVPAVTDLINALQAADAAKATEYAKTAVSAAGGSQTAPPDLAVLVSEAEWLGKITSAGRMAEAAGLEERSQVVKLYRDAAAWLKSLPYGADLAAERGWDQLMDHADALEQHINSLRQSSEAVSEIRNALRLDFKTGLALLQEKLEAAPDSYALTDLGIEYGKRALDAGRPSAAYHILQTVRTMGRLNALQAEKYEEVESGVIANLVEADIRRAFQDSNWTALPTLAVRIPASTKKRNAAWFTHLVGSFKDKFDQKIKQEAYLAAVQIDEALVLLEGVNENRRAQLATLAEKIHKTSQKVEDQRLAVLRANLIRWANEQSVDLNQMLVETPIEQYSKIEERVKQVQEHLAREYGDLKTDQFYIGWSQWLSGFSEYLDNNRQKVGEYNEALAAVDRSLLVIVDQISALDIPAANQTLIETSKKLGKVPQGVVGWKKMQDRLNAAADLTIEVEKIKLSELVGDARKAYLEVTSRLDYLAKIAKGGRSVVIPGEEEKWVAYLNQPFTDMLLKAKTAVKKAKDEIGKLDLHAWSNRLGTARLGFSEVEDMEKNLSALESAQLPLARSQSSIETPFAGGRAVGASISSVSSTLLERILLISALVLGLLVLAVSLFGFYRQGTIMSQMQTLATQVAEVRAGGVSLTEAPSATEVQAATETIVETETATESATEAATEAVTEIAAEVTAVPDPIEAPSPCLQLVFTPDSKLLNLPVNADPAVPNSYFDMPPVLLTGVDDCELKLDETGILTSNGDPLKVFSLAEGQTDSVEVLGTWADQGDSKYAWTPAGQGQDNMPIPPLEAGKYSALFKAGEKELARLTFEVKASLEQYMFVHSSPIYSEVMGEKPVDATPAPSETKINSPVILMGYYKQGDTTYLRFMFSTRRTPYWSKLNSIMDSGTAALKELPPGLPEITQ